MAQDNDLNLEPISKAPGSYPAGTGVGSASGAARPVDADDDVIETLNDLLETCRDGEYGFRECAEHTKAADLKTLLSRHAEECVDAGSELQALIHEMGGTNFTGGSLNLVRQTGEGRFASSAFISATFLALRSTQVK